MSTDQLNRMISFRLSTEEYERCRQLCQERGISSVSEIARSALELLFQQPPSESLEARLSVVEQRLDELLRAHGPQAIGRASGY